MEAMRKTQEFPSSGWIIDSVDDLGADRDAHELCEYCAKEIVRYLHELRHPNLAGARMWVGCICAGRLSGDPDRANALDRAARNVSARRANWCTLKGWHLGRKGGLILKKDGRIFALNSSKYGSFAGSWTGRGDDVWQRVDGWHRDLDAAKLALFDVVYGAQETSEEVAA